MSRSTRIVLLSFGLAVWLAPLSNAQYSYLNEAVQALQSGNVYVSAEVSDIDNATQEQLAQQAANTGVGVVALPSDAASEANGDLPQFAAKIAEATGNNTVV